MPKKNVFFLRNWSCITKERSSIETSPCVGIYEGVFIFDINISIYSVAVPLANEI